MDSDKAPAVESVQSTSSVSAVARPRDFIGLLRPTQWVKNVVVFAGPAAGLKLSSAVAFKDAVAAFIAFCLAASATYAINDVLDREADARHPTKRDRAVARGAIRPSVALGIGCLLALGAATVSTLLLNAQVTAVLATYFTITVAYSVTLKRRVILDVIIVALGFVLRAWAGSLAVGVVTSEWLVACVFTLCLFMGFGKRRCELAMIGDKNEAWHHRRTLLRYTPDLLNHLITVSAGIAVITFLLYTMDTSAHPAPFPKEHLFYTLPLVVYGIFRFAMLTELGVYAGPTEIVLRDRPLLMAILLWAVCALAIAYGSTFFGPGGLEVPSGNG
ncbi:MAG: decaprenyl-phosphate phosphoribosyltransferase [Phycisphaerales bacterium]|nr:MAG: decaprenyl-phosphate phosphoribosyltransferase [Phycisphaerales bacterium]